MPCLRPATFALVPFLLAGALRPAAAQVQPTATSPTAATPTTLRDRWADSARRAIEVAAAHGDAAALAGVRAMLGRALVLTPGDALLQHYLGYAAYREAMSCLSGGDRAGARQLLEQADTLLDRSAARLALPESYALRSSTIGMLIGTGNPASGMWLGPKAGAAMDQALASGPRNPRVWLLRGMSAYNTPAVWGGGADKARAYLTQAVALFAADRPAASLPAWGEAEAHLRLGRALQRSGDTNGARAAYARALALQPDNAWLTRVLIPSLDAPPAAAGAARP